MSRCDICDGSRVIRLPVRHEVPARVESYDAMDMRISSRTYPCPQCGEGVGSDRLAIVEVGAEQVHRWIGDRQPEMMEHIRSGVARRLARQIIESGLIAFQVREEGPDSFSVRAKLGAVSPAQVATFEERVIAHQDKTAQAVADLAITKITLWGSHYHGNEGPIHKAQAIRSIRDALEEIRGRKPGG